jgi:hypothetical protein
MKEDKKKNMKVEETPGVQESKTFVTTGEAVNSPEGVEPKVTETNGFEVEQKMAKIAEEQKERYGESSVELETRESGETLESGEYNNPGQKLPEQVGRTVEGIEGDAVRVDQDERFTN